MSGFSSSALRNVQRCTTAGITAAILLVQALVAPAAAASIRCETLFRSSLAPTLSETLPSELRAEFANAKPSIVEKFEKRFEKRERIRAEREAMRLVSLLLLDQRETTLNLRSLLDRTNRSQTISQVLIARLKNEATRVKLENILIEIGYSEGSLRSQKWRAFREKHFRRLESIKRFAINTAAATTIGIPIYYLRSFQYQQFQTSRELRTDWAKTELELRKRIDHRDPKIMREIKIEIAIEVARRIIAIAILAILADEFLNLMSPKWRVLKAEVRGTLSMDSRESLEHAALENWQDVAEAFTGSRPADNSPEALEVLRQIRATSREELWLHVHEGGPLDGAQSATNSAGSPTPAELELQMTTTPMLAP